MMRSATLFRAVAFEWAGDGAETRIVGIILIFWPTCSRHTKLSAPPASGQRNAGRWLAGGGVFGVRVEA